MENINFLALIAGAVVPMVIGFIWYGPIFGKAWQNSLGMSDEDVQSGNMPVIFGISFLVAMVFSYYLYRYVGYHPEEEQTFTHSAFHGAQIALMTAVPVLISNSLFEKKNWTNILINASYWTLTFAIIGGVMSLFY
ncbi:MAG: DUF1761 domain-containing protein [Saprospiraceae bacterium]|nr:DUF1761 domain-containing protein [Bacteroidia bacterium]NNE16191.1 DUF1761 domain-containing protein [Saprospiraceae bacterium]NNL92386.1 DUF1761 domain-containing protein [Saprospiraceae bacterium]